MTEYDHDVFLSRVWEGGKEKEEEKKSLSLDVVKHAMGMFTVSACLLYLLYPMFHNS